MAINSQGKPRMLNGRVACQITVLRPRVRELSAWLNLVVLLEERLLTSSYPSHDSSHESSGVPCGRRQVARGTFGLGGHTAALYCLAGFFLPLAVGRVNWHELVRRA